MTDKTKVDEKHMNEVENLGALDEMLAESQKSHEERLVAIVDMRKKLNDRIIRLNWRD